MKLLKNIFIVAIFLTLPSHVMAAEDGKVKPHLDNKMQYPNDANGDVFRRMQKSDFDFSKPYDVEFFAVFRTEAMAESVGMEYLADSRAGDKMQSINTKPAQRGGMELRLVKKMYVTYDNVTNFERKLAKRVSKQEGYLDGWGVLQQ